MPEKCIRRRWGGQGISQDMLKREEKPSDSLCENEIECHSGVATLAQIGNIPWDLCWIVDGSKYL